MVWHATLDVIMKFTGIVTIILIIAVLILLGMLIGAITPLWHH